MIRNAAHGRTFLQATAFSRQCDLQFLGSHQRIVEKHFIEISQTIKKDTVLILLLGLHIFLHHWCQFSHDLLLFCKRIHDKADTQKLAYPHLS